MRVLDISVFDISRVQVLALAAVVGLGVLGTAGCGHDDNSQPPTVVTPAPRNTTVVVPGGSGTPGPAGAPGPAGRPGASGPAGASGASGAPGAAGASGGAGTAGASGGAGTAGTTGGAGATGQ